MSDDLIARLRAHATDRIWSEDLYDEAADEIERLQAELARFVPLPSVKMTDQWGNPYPAYTTVPEPSE